MPFRVALLYRADPDPHRSRDLHGTRFARIAEALRDAGVECEGAPYAEEAADEIHGQLLRVDGVLVWVNPVEGDRDRLALNAMLEDVAAGGVFVSAHPELIGKMGTKDVLYRTRSMGWGSDTRLYRDLQALRDELPRRLAAGETRVLKRQRGNGGDGVWKVAAVDPAAAGSGALTPETLVRARHAKRGCAEEEMTLERFTQLCEPYFRGGGAMIDQAYQSRLSDGMVRCYLVGGSVAGFGEQLVNALYPAPVGAHPRTAPATEPRQYFPPSRQDFQPLKDRLETEWLSEMCETLDLDIARLPVIWDADFLYGPTDETGADTFVLCEINVSSVFPFPDHALGPLATETLARLKRKP